MCFDIRLERPGDYRAVEALTCAAFWRDKFWEDGSSGCDEHYLAHALRTYPAFIPELDFVAQKGDTIVGNIMYIHAKVIDAGGRAHPVLLFGPLSVLPAYQRQGVGTALVRHSADAARALGHRAVIIYGHPGYYPRLGFRPASDFGITHSDGTAFAAHMAMELVPGALANVSGRFCVDIVYEDLPKQDVAAFDQRFR